MKTPLLICATWSILLVACAHTSKQQNNSPAPTDSLHEYSVSHLQTDTLNPEQIQLHAELVYDSTSYLVIENRSTLPVRTDCNYEFAHYIHYKWKRTDINHTDTSSFTIPAGGKDTIWIDFKKQIGYEPIGKCSIGKTFYTLSRPAQPIHKAIEAQTRSIIIDWTRCELIPDHTELTNLYAEMKAIPSEEYILLTIRNHSNDTLICGDETDYSLSIYQDNQWKEISYARISHDLAVVLPPHDSISHWKYRLPYGRYHFKPGRYRITKKFSFEADYHRRFHTAAEFTLDYEIYADKEGKMYIKHPSQKE